MLEQLRKALEEREDAYNRMVKLRGLIERGEATGEESRALFRDYRKQFERTDMQVKSIRESVRRELDVLEASYHAYDAQRQKLQAEANGAGAVSPEKYHRALTKNTDEKQRVSEQIRYVRQLFSAERANDLAGVAPPSGMGRRLGASMTADSEQNGHIFLRIIQGFSGLLILSGVYLPLIRTPILGTYSLFTAIRSVATAGTALATEDLGLMGSTPLTLDTLEWVWIVPTLLGLSIGATALVPRRRLRGGILLLLTLALLLPMVTGLSAFVAYPRIGSLFEEGVMDVAFGGMIAGALGSIVGCFAIGTLTAYILCLLNFRPSVAGRTLWGVSLILLVVYGTGLGLYFRFGLAPAPALQLVSGESGAFAQGLRVTVENKGNLSLEVVGSHRDTMLSKAPQKTVQSALKRYQYMLILEQESEDGAWRKADSQFTLGMGLLDSSRAVVEHGKEASFTSSVRPAEKAHSYRVALLGANGTQIYSNVVTVDAQAPRVQASVSGSSASAPISPPPDSAVEETRRAITALRSLSRSARLEEFANGAEEARRTAYKIADSKERDRFLLEIDEILMPLVEEQVRKGLAAAERCYNDGRLEETERHAREALDAYRRYLTVIDSESRELHQQAQGFLTAVDVAKNPSRYYRVQAINVINDFCQAVVVDQYGVSYRLSVNDPFGYFVVAEIDRAKGVVLKRGGETQVIKR